MRSGSVLSSTSMTEMKRVGDDTSSMMSGSDTSFIRMADDGEGSNLGGSIY